MQRLTVAVVSTIVLFATGVALLALAVDRAAPVVGVHKPLRRLREHHGRHVDADELERRSRFREPLGDESRADSEIDEPSWRAVGDELHQQIELPAAGRVWELGGVPVSRNRGVAKITG